MPTQRLFSLCICCLEANLFHVYLSETKGLRQFKSIIQPVSVEVLGLVRLHCWQGAKKSRSAPQAQLLSDSLYLYTCDAKYCTEYYVYCLLYLACRHSVNACLHIIMVKCLTTALLNYIGIFF